MSSFKFSCPRCGQHLAADLGWCGAAIQCPNCDANIVVPSPSPAPDVGFSSARPPGTATTIALPTPAPRRSPPPLRRPAPGAGVPGIAIAALVLGIASLLFGILAGIPAIVCGHMTLSQIRSGRAASGKGFGLTGLILGYASIVLTVIVAAILVSAAIRAAKEARSQPPFSTGPSWRQPSSGAPGSGSSATSGSRPPSTKTLPATDPANAEIPDKPVSGTIKGQAFNLQGATLENGILTLREGKDFIPDRQFLIFLFLRQDESIGGKVYTVRPAGGPSTPHVHLRWKDGTSSQSTAMSSGYAMRLEFGQPAGSQIRGKIYLELSKEDATTISGTFVAETQSRPAGAGGSKTKRP